MATLSINEFSCLREANLTLAPVNVIIGPQGSGKSVTTKLFYFCSDVVNMAIQSAERGDTYELFKRDISRHFNVWFPPSAWGSGRFNIAYNSGEFSVRILRRRKGGTLADEVSVTFSDWFASTYHSMLTLFEHTEIPSETSLAPEFAVRDVIDRSYRTRSAIQRQLTDQLSRDYIRQQTFIPAGRAFFTSIGRLVAGLETTGSLDPVTLKFARLFATLRDRNSSRALASRMRALGEDFIHRRSSFMGRLFGGEIRREGEAEYVQAADGRKIPFTSLSSGQQELLPMWSLIDYFNEIDAIERSGPGRPSGRKSSEIVYIEEPEAHLFPSAQSLLMDFLIGSVASENNRRSLVLTTHSPYIMAKLNVFIKAGQLARRRKRNTEVNEVVPRDCWLAEGQLAAFAIEDGQLRSLIDDDGLIDGTCLDGISDDINRQFSRLLAIEAGL